MIGGVFPFAYLEFEYWIYLMIRKIGNFDKRLTRLMVVLFWVMTDTSPVYEISLLNRLRHYRNLRDFRLNFIYLQRYSLRLEMLDYKSNKIQELNRTCKANN